MSAVGTIASAEELGLTLERLAGNLAYSWHPEIIDVFVALLGAEEWEHVERNPTALLQRADSADLERAFADAGYLLQVERALAALEEDLTAPSWWRQLDQDGDDLLVAYFSAEFGLDESLPVYSGGLGVLAGDHLKAASDLDLPLVGVGLLYREGYFRQGLDESGWQTELYPYNHPSRLPMSLVQDEEGRPLEVSLDMGDEQMRAYIWRVAVGRVELYLLDSEVEGNSPQAMQICDRLYGGDREHRIRQEVLLGVGGVKALRALGLKPTVFHLNEGHSAFLQLERVRELVEAGASFDEAVARLKPSTVFTTHTPVPAGNEVFDVELVGRYLGGLVDSLGVDFDDFLAMGRVAGEPSWGFGLTPFALRVAAQANGVSELHGQVSREMWAGLDEGASIGHVTNGVHARTWLSGPLLSLLKAHGANVNDGLDHHFACAESIGDEALWRVHQERKRVLLDAVSRRYRHQRQYAGDLDLDPDALTIGFARRFATYKRAGLLFQDSERLARLLCDSERPLQILIAGKAHPQDDGGKELIKSVVEFTKDPRSCGRVVFLQDYEMTLAKRLVQGVDVWLNNPRRPEEASGTSGMKAAMNGVLNCSILDGWWVEGYSADVGFKIGVGGEADDATDAADLMRVIEEEIIPLYYTRDDGLPREWIKRMRAAIVRLGAEFNTGRMVRQYAEQYYLPAYLASDRAGR